jgi:hypothetical protein
LLNLPRLRLEYNNWLGLGRHLSALKELLIKGLWGAKL